MEMNRDDFSVRPLLPMEFGEIQQVAYIVENLEDATHLWRHSERVSPFLICRDISPFTKGTFRDNPCGETTINVGFSYIGGMQLELIEVCSDEPSIYHEALEKFGQNVHHYAVHTREFAKTHRWALENGYAAVLESGIDGLARMSYLEHEDHSFIIELIELNALTQPYFDGIDARWAQLSTDHGNVDFNILKLTQRGTVVASLLKFAANSMLGRIDRTR